MRILLVEDEPRMANVIAKGLRENAYAVDMAEDGDAALYQASINDYDLIVLDVLLPMTFSRFLTATDPHFQGKEKPARRAGVVERSMY